MPNNSEVINWSLSNETNPLGMTGLGVKNLNGSSKSTQYDMTDQTPMFNPYENVFYKDLDLDTTKAYTISITMDNLKTVHNDYSKNLNLFTFGQHLAGENCGVFTVGTDTTTNSLKPVIGTLGKKPADTKKALPIVNAVDLAAVSNTDQVKFTLTYNPVEKGDDRLMLFVNDVKQCTGEGLGIDHHNFVVTRPRLYFLYSGWTNEVGWENKFDYSAQRVVNVKIDRVALYPASYYASKFQSVALEFSSSVPDFNVASFANSAQVQVIMTNSQDIGVKTLEIVSGASTFVLSSSSIAVDGKETFVGTVTDGFPSGFLSTNTVRLLIDGNALPNVLTLPTSSKYFVDHDAPSLNVNGKSTKGITFDKQEGQEVHLTFEYVQDNTIQHDVQITGNEINATTMLTANTSDSLVNNNPIRLDIVAVRADNYQDSQTVNDYVTNFLASVDPTTVPKTSAIIKSTGLYDLTGGSLINELKISDFLEVDRYYTGYYFIIAKATDKAGNVSEYMQVEVPITNKVSVVDQFSPEIAIYELTESPENNIPGITLKGHAYDEASYFDVYAVAVLSSQANTFALDATLKDFLVNNAVQTRVLNDQAASTGALASNLGFLNTDTRLTKYWNGAQFANIQLDNQYTAFAMCIEDSGKFNYNLDKYDGFVSIDQSVASFGVNPAQSSLADVQTTTVDGTTTHIVKPGAVLDLVWTMNYSGSQDTDFEASFNSVPMSVLAIDQFTFKASFTVDQNTSGDADGKLVFALKYLPKQAVSVHAENVCLEALEVTNDFNVVPEINGSDYEHTTLKVDNIITAIPKSALKNMGVFYGFAFDVELSVGVTNGGPNGAYVRQRELRRERHLELQRLLQRHLLLQIHGVARSHRLQPHLDAPVQRPVRLVHQNAKHGSGRTQGVFGEQRHRLVLRRGDVHHGERRGRHGHLRHRHLVRVPGGWCGGRVHLGRHHLPRGSHRHHRRGEESGGVRARVGHLLRRGGGEQPRLARRPEPDERRLQGGLLREGRQEQLHRDAGGHPLLRRLLHRKCDHGEQQLHDLHLLKTQRHLDHLLGHHVRIPC